MPVAIDHDGELSPDVAYNIRIRLVLMKHLRLIMRARGLTQVNAAALFQVSQSRVSHLANNLVHRFTVDTLLNMLAHTGEMVSVSVEAPRSGAAQSMPAGRLRAFPRRQENPAPPRRFPCG